MLQKTCLICVLIKIYKQKLLIDGKDKTIALIMAYWISSWVLEFKKNYNEQPTYTFFLSYIGTGQKQKFCLLFNEQNPSHLKNVTFRKEIVLKDMFDTILRCLYKK